MRDNSTAALIESSEWDPLHTTLAGITMHKSRKKKKKVLKLDLSHAHHVTTVDDVTAAINLFLDSFR